MLIDWPASQKLLFAIASHAKLIGLVQVVAANHLLGLCTHVPREYSVVHRRPTVTMKGGYWYYLVP